MLWTTTEGLSCFAQARRTRELRVERWCLGEARGGLGRAGTGRAGVGCAKSAKIVRIGRLSSRAQRGTCCPSESRESRSLAALVMTTFYFGPPTTMLFVHCCRRYLISFIGSSVPYSWPLLSVARAITESKASRSSGYLATIARMTARLSWKATPESAAFGF